MVEGLKRSTEKDVGALASQTQPSITLRHDVLSLNKKLHALQSAMGQLRRQDVDTEPNGVNLAALSRRLNLEPKDGSTNTAGRTEAVDVMKLQVRDRSR